MRKNKHSVGKCIVFGSLRTIHENFEKKILIIGKIYNIRLRDIGIFINVKLTSFESKLKLVEGQL